MTGLEEVEDESHGERLAKQKAKVIPDALADWRKVIKP